MLTSFISDAERFVTSYAGYSFSPTLRQWKISRDNTLSLPWIDDFFEDSLKTNFLKVLIYYVETYSAGHANNLSDRFREFSRFIYTARGRLDLVSSNDLINYRSTLSREHEWYLGSIRGFLRKWVDLGYSGVDPNVIALLSEWRLKGNIKGRAIQTLCPKEGALSDFEFEALHQSIIDAFEIGQIDLEQFVLIQLFIATGRRPSQLADLKAKDFIEARASNGLREFLLNVPRRKQRSSHWRSSFKAFALISDLGLLVNKLLERNRFQLITLAGGASFIAANELPIFPSWPALNRLPSKNIDEFLPTEKFHRATADLSLNLKKVISSLSVVSERTGQPLHVFPTRLRRTLATRAAREGFGELVIAELLDHTDTQNARVYRENVPEHVDAINEAVARQLAPLAQAFAGVLVDREKDARRGDDLSSRVRCEKGNVGTCGHYGFCRALAPIACYTCRNFQPWLEGPHAEVLVGLISERERVLQVTKDKTMAAINDRTILAVTQVIQNCEERRRMSLVVCHG